MPDTYHIAQINIARMKAPLDDPLMAEFIENIDRINQLGESAPGFVWRLKGENDNATAIRIFEDDALIINMSVWTDVEALKAFTYDTAHRYFVKHRKRWFSHMGDAYYALWWIPAGTYPTPAEAKARLEHLRAHGPTPHAFTFPKAFAPEDAATP
ncbi:MAG: DUF3291 domain-containing protein [Rhodothermales bacterium]